MKSNIRAKYPKLMVAFEGLNIGTVVLFACEKEGVVVRGKGTYKPGRFYVNWCMSSFKDFNGEVVLSNE